MKVPFRLHQVLYRSNMIRIFFRGIFCGKVHQIQREVDLSVSFGGAEQQIELFGVQRLQKMVPKGPVDRKRRFLVGC